ncbi:hypothetical protein BKI52_30850 [marine bacterium AO1-C]|nr:hypothetical protein BKI52_30850 [marine bacterium AO1-C]
MPEHSQESTGHSTSNNSTNAVSQQPSISSGQQPIASRHQNVNRGQRRHKARQRPVIRFNPNRKDVDAKLAHMQDLLLQLDSNFQIAKVDLHAIVMKYLVGQQGVDPNTMSPSDLVLKVRPFMAPEYVELERSRRMSAGKMNKVLSQTVYPDIMQQLDDNPVLKAKYIDQMSRNRERARKDQRGKLHQGISLDSGLTDDESLQQLFIQANLSLMEFDQKLEEVASMFQRGGKFVKAKASSIKGWERAHEKQHDKYGQDATRILDLVRGTLVFESVTDLVQGQRYISQVFEVYRIKNTIGSEFTDTGYQDMKINVQLSTGHIGELQLNLKSMVHQKGAGGHGLYRFIRAFDEGKTYKPADKAKAVERLQPVLEALGSKRDRRIAQHEQDSGISQRGPLDTSSVDGQIAFIEQLIRRINNDETFDIQPDEGKMLKRISRIIYKPAKDDIDREIGSRPRLGKAIGRINLASH